MGPRTDLTAQTARVSSALHHGPSSLPPLGNGLHRCAPLSRQVVQVRACVVGAVGQVPNASCDAQSGAEIARAVTSFGRRVPRRVIDITPIAPLLAAVTGSQSVNLTMYSAPWAGDQGHTPWLSTLSLRVTRDSTAHPGGSVLAPWAGVTTESGGISRVFRWIAFNQSFGRNFPPFTLNLPPAEPRLRVRLYAIITGHGNDNHGCGEFCATEHRFMINGRASVAREDLLPLSDPQAGCAEEVDAGVTPNEYGTWLYGRDGWCNGRPVEPFVVDVTDLVYDSVGTNGTRRQTNGADATATIEYRAQWCSALGVCGPPNPGPPDEWSQAAPVMMVSVYVVLGEAPVHRAWFDDYWLWAIGAAIAGVLSAGAAAARVWLRRQRRWKSPLASADTLASSDHAAATSEPED